jgi:hypothetical protein
LPHPAYFEGIKNRKVAQTSVQKAQDFTSDLPTGETPPVPLKVSRRSLAIRAKEMFNIPALQGIVFTLATLLGGVGVVLSHHQKQAVQNLQENYSVTERNPGYLQHLKQENRKHAFLAMPLLALIAMLLSGTAQASLSALREMRDGMDETDALEAFLTAKPETDPQRQQMIPHLQRHIQGQISAMAQGMTERAKTDPNFQQELREVFGAEEAPPSVETLTRLFHYLTTVSIRHSQQHAPDGQPAAPLSQTDYLVKMAALVELAQLRGNLFEVLSDEADPSEADLQTLQPQMLQLLTLAEVRIRARSEQWADSARERAILLEEVQQLREQLAEQQKEKRQPSQAQSQAVQQFTEKLHTLTHRPDPPIFLAEEVAALGLALPLEDLAESRDALGSEKRQAQEETLAPSEGDALLAALTRMDESLSRTEAHYEAALKILQRMK